jgi:hypothetical protein
VVSDPDQIEQVIEKIRNLPPETVAEVGDFVDYLRSRGVDVDLRVAATRVSERSFARVWENPDDAIYDRL